MAHGNSTFGKQIGSPPNINDVVALAAADTLVVLAPFYSDLEKTLAPLKMVLDKIDPALRSGTWIRLTPLTPPR